MFKTEQESFWAGEFGAEYTQRNVGSNIVASNLAMFSSILRKTNSDINSLLEFGCNIGLNLQALKNLLPNTKDFSAIEINKTAVEQCKQLGFVNQIYEQSILDFKTDYQRDFVLIKCVMIHINPEFLPTVYKLLYETSQKYICIAEYYNPTPVQVNYRGNNDRLFKRDFCGEMMSAYPDLELVDYGFCYHKDKCFPQDDITWFLLKK